MISSNIIKIDSSQAINYYNDYKTSFQAKFDEINCDTDQYILYNLISISIPYSFYSCNNSNNVLDLIEISNSITTHRTILMEHGNYSTSDFSKKLLEELNGVNQIVYYIVYLKIPNRYHISVNNGSSCIMLFNTGANRNRSIHNFLGFSSIDVTINSSNPVISNQCVVMNEIYYLQLKSDLGTQTMLMSDGTDSILDIIPVASIPYSIINYSPINQQKFTYSNRSLSSISISLLDNLGNDIDLNNVSYYMTFNIEIHHRDIDVNDPRESKSNLEIFYDDPTLLNKDINGSMQPSLPEYNDYQDRQNYYKYMMFQKYIKSFQTKKISNKNIRNDQGRKEGQKSKKG